MNKFIIIALFIIPCLIIPTFGENDIQTQVIQSDNKTIISYIVIPKEVERDHLPYSNGDVMVTSATLILVLGLGSTYASFSKVRDIANEYVYILVSLFFVNAVFIGINFYIIYSAFIDSLDQTSFLIYIIVTASIVIAGAGLIAMLFLKSFDRTSMETKIERIMNLASSNLPITE